MQDNSQSIFTTKPLNDDDIDFLKSRIRKGLLPHAIVMLILNTFFLIGFTQLTQGFLLEFYLVLGGPVSALIMFFGWMRVKGLRKDLKGRTKKCFTEVKYESAILEDAYENDSLLRMYVWDYATHDLSQYPDGTELYFEVAPFSMSLLEIHEVK